MAVKDLKWLLLILLFLMLACDAPAFLTRATPTVLFAIGDATLTPLPRTTLTPTRALPQPGMMTATPAPAEIESAMNLQEIAELKINAPVRFIWSLDEQSLGVVTQFGVAVFNAQTWRLVRTIPISDPVRLLDISPDMRLYITTVAEARMLDLRDLNTGTVLRSIRLESPALGVNFSPDGKWVVIANTEGIAVTLWDAQTGQLSQKYTGFETAAPVYGARIASDNKTLIWISRGTIQLMDLASGKFGARLGHEDFVLDQVLTPDGKTLVTIAEGTIIFWDVATRNKFRINPPLNPSSLALSPQGRVVVYGANNSVALWDVSLQKLLNTLTRHTVRVNAVTFAREGFRLASASEDGVVKVWGVVK